MRPSFVCLGMVLGTVRALLRAVLELNLTTQKKCTRLRCAGGLISSTYQALPLMSISFWSTSNEPRPQMSAVNVSQRVLRSREPPALPFFVPPPGTFADLPADSNTTMNSVRSAGRPNGEQAGPHQNWTTAKYLPDVGEYGAYLVMPGGGHVDIGSVLWDDAMVRPLDGVSGWESRSSHGVMLEPGEGAPTATYGEFFASTQATSSGWPYPGHLYTGVVVQTVANGGTLGWGSPYTVMMGGWGGASPRAVYKHDLSNPTAVPTRVIDDIGITGSGNSYPCCIEDHARGGFWTLNYNGNGPLVWTDFATYTRTLYAGVVFNDEKDYQFGLSPERSCLVAAGGTTTGYHVRVSVVTAGVPAAFVDVTLGGTTPPNALAGIEWCPLLGKFAAYESMPDDTATIPASAYIIHWLTPPADLTAGTWVWSRETLTGHAGAVIHTHLNTNNGLFRAMRVYSKFRWIPKLKSFGISTGMATPFQLWRPAGT